MGPHGGGGSTCGSPVRLEACVGQAPPSSGWHVMVKLTTSHYLLSLCFCCHFSWARKVFCRVSYQEEVSKCKIRGRAAFLVPSHFILTEDTVLELMSSDAGHHPASTGNVLWVLHRKYLTQSFNEWMHLWVKEIKNKRAICCCFLFLRHEPNQGSLWWNTGKLLWWVMAWTGLKEKQNLCRESKRHHQ